MPHHRPCWEIPTPAKPSGSGQFLSLRDSWFISVSVLIKLDNSFNHYPLTTYYLPGILVNRDCNNNNYQLLNGY